MVARMLCKKCKKVTPLLIMDTHYKRGLTNKETTLYKQICCSSEYRWTKDYLIDNHEYKFRDWRDKNGC